MEMIQHHRRGRGALFQRQGTGDLQRFQTLLSARQEEFDEGFITAGLLHQAFLHPADGVRQSPLLERRPIAQRTGFAFQDGQVMPRVEDRLAATEAARVIGHDLLVSHDLNALGVGP